MLSGDPSDQSSLLDAPPPAPAVLAVIPTWLLRSTVVSVPAKLLYLYLSALNDGDEMTVRIEDVLTAVPHLHQWYDHDPADNGLWGWLDELQTTALVSFNGERGPRPDAEGYRVRFDLYRQEPSA